MSDLRSMESQVVEVDPSTIDDGLMLDELNEKLKFIIKDVLTRKFNEKKRSVTCTIEIEPEIDPATEQNLPFITWKVNYSVPGNKGRKTQAFVKDGKLKIRSRATHRQPSLFTGEQKQIED